MDAQELLRQLDSGRTSLGQLRGLGPVELEMLYTLGHGLYGRGRADDAADVFTLLTIYEPTEPRFWFARGAAAQERRRFDEAITAYGFSALLDGRNPWPLVHLGECLLLGDDGETAREALRRALDRARDAHDEEALARACTFLEHAEVCRG